MLWVGNIGSGVGEAELNAEFGRFGKIENIRILHNKFCAFVNFDIESNAQRAKKALNGAILGGQYIVVNYRKVGER